MLAATDKYVEELVMTNRNIPQEEGAAANEL